MSKQRSKPFCGVSRETIPTTGAAVRSSKPDLAQQRPLAVPLAGEVGRRIVIEEVGIGRRVPVVVVDAVDDPDQPVGAGAQQAVEPEAVLRGLDLAGEGAADRRQRVGLEEARCSGS